ncbi:MAG: TonB-dependent receptor [Bacteroidales bacterium]|nr:TonB-dependent receptor [Bacteroidales bacterium]
MIKTNRIMAVVVLVASLLMSYSTMAQTVKGKIVDAENGETLIGATVKVAGTSKGAAASLDGTFSFKAPLGDQTLVFSYVGYIKKEMNITVEEGNNILGTVKLDPNAIGLQEIKVVSSYVKDRQTPVSISTIKPQEIEERMSTKEFPELMKTTPSVYATKQGGGYGDSRINLRGFDSDNIGVLINGVPINDMESGQVYWSNWAGLSNVTRTIQVQRGLGASKLAISSVGGTINIITNSTDATKGGSVYVAAGNDAYTKRGFTVSTGLMDNDWAITLSGSMENGDGYMQATNFRAYSYFANVSKKINENHHLSLTAFGAPQWHNQRGSMHMIGDYINDDGDLMEFQNDYRDQEEGIKYSSHYGMREGEIYNTGYAYNEYHKPQISLNHYWSIDDETRLSTAVYSSFSSGGGRRVDGAQDHWLEFEYPSGEPYGNTKLTPDGLLDYDAVFAANAASDNGSQAIMSMAVNRHDWYGILSSLNTKVNNINITAGVDGRYYKGYHYTEITDLMGGDEYLDEEIISDSIVPNNVNREPGKPLQEGDKINYYNTGEVLWGGLFAQAELVEGNYSAFLSLSGVNTSYRRVDYFTYKDTDPMQSSNWANFLDYSVKGGANYNINEFHNAFVNIGYFTRAPFFRYVFLNYTNEINEGAKHENIFSFELGYGLTKQNIDVDLTLYHTEWLNKTLTRSLGDYTANLTGLDAIHQGIELEATYQPSRNLTLEGMVSVGDWRWSDNLIADVYDDQQNYLETISIYAEDIHVGNAAQTTASLSADWQVFNDFKLGGTFYHADRLFADFDIENRTSEDLEGVDAWNMPDYQLVDIFARYNFDLAGFDASIIGNVDNLLDTEYISDALDGDQHNAFTSPVFYGFGRTWRISLKVNF